MSAAADHGCSSTPATSVRAACPVSGDNGNAVERRTPSSLLVDPDRLGSGPYFFCPGVSCDVVYFTAAGDEVYRRRDLTLRVGLKETKDPVPVCYCFDFTRSMLRDELKQTGATTIPQQIRDGIKAGRCACEIKNPQGSCCLGTVAAAVRNLEAGLGLAKKEERS